MSYEVDPNPLASALPGGIKYDLGRYQYWRAPDIAKFQAERLAESGYQLVYVGDDATVQAASAPADEQVDQAAMIVRSTQDPPAVSWADLPQGVRDIYLEQVRHVLAALTEVAAQ